MTDTDLNRVWKLMESIRYCMLSNWTGTTLHSRPMGALVRRREHAVYFFTDERAHKDHEIGRYPLVCLAFADTSGQKYLSVSGTAEISADREKIKKLWAKNAGQSEYSPDQGYAGGSRILGCAGQPDQRFQGCLRAGDGRISRCGRAQEGSALMCSSQ